MTDAFSPGIGAPTDDLFGPLGYQLRLPGFEGPLDVLLRLIERNHMPITDVSLLAVTDQFLAYFQALLDPPPTVLADFTAMGSRLVLMKSRSLLPRPASTDDNADTGDLARQLIEYQAIRDAAQRLAQRDAEGLGMFVRDTPVPLSGATARPAEPVRLASYASSTLARALRRRLGSMQAPQTLLRSRPSVTLRTMVSRIWMRLSGQESVSFASISEGCRDRHELLTAFLALLVLVRRRTVDADQPHTFGDITLRRALREGTEFHEGLPGDILAELDDSRPAPEARPAPSASTRVVAVGAERR